MILVEFRRVWLSSTVLMGKQVQLFVNLFIETSLIFWKIQMLTLFLGNSLSFKSYFPVHKKLFEKNKISGEECGPLWYVGEVLPISQITVFRHNFLFYCVSLHLLTGLHCWEITAGTP